MSERDIGAGYHGRKSSSGRGRGRGRGGGRGRGSGSRTRGAANEIAASTNAAKGANAEDLHPNDKSIKDAPIRNHRFQPKKGRGTWGETSNRNHNKKNNHTRNNSYNNQHKKAYDKGGKRGQLPLKVYCTGDGEEDRANGFAGMHRDCKALRYKVHKPMCDCPKLLRMVRQSEATIEGTTITEDGKIDALVVVPDTKQRYLYVCSDTSLDRFEEDPRGAERKLRAEIFGGSEGGTTPVDESSFKLSCAGCLLFGHEPNGFCLVASPSFEAIDAVREESLRSKNRRADGPLHHDHAHFVAGLPRSSLWDLHRAKTRAQNAGAVETILCHLSGQGVSAGTEPTADRLSGGIELGHHLTSALSLTQNGTKHGSHRKPPAVAPGDVGDEPSWWFVIGYDDGSSLELDLPGGKRHLGETSLEGAIRETEEEASLVWDPSWVVECLESKKASERGNRYYLLRPPQSFLEQRGGDG